MEQDTKGQATSLGESACFAFRNYILFKREIIGTYFIKAVNLISNNQLNTDILRLFRKGVLVA